MKSAVNWFEIPVENYERAKTFYQTVLNEKVDDMPMPEGKYGVFNYEREVGVGGAIFESKESMPSKIGTIVYLNGGDDLSVCIDRVVDAGGEIVIPKTQIGENGFIAHIIDSEGNKVGFHSVG